MVNLNLNPDDKLHLEHNCDYLDYPFVFSCDHLCKLPNGSYYTIKKGTPFDFASIPTVFKVLFNKRSQSRRAQAYAIHDSMYVDNHKNRRYADMVFLDAMNKLTPKNRFANYIQFICVRVFSWFYWNN